MYFDTHAHYDDKAFNSGRDELLKSLPSKGVSLVVNPGQDRLSSETAISYAERYGHIYAAVGWHPHDAKKMRPKDADFIREAVEKHRRVVAIGEIGLDYHYDFSPREIQRGVFIRQMEIAEELKLPVIVHDREAHADVLGIVRQFPDVRGVFHCFSGSAEMARELVSLGWYVSFTGVVTFKNARRALEAVAAVPHEYLMLETDAPYMTPEPYRGRRNSSLYLPLIAAAVGEIYGMTAEEVAKLTAENGKRFFGIE